MPSSSKLVDLVGFPATLIHADTTTLDRWVWLTEHLPRTRNGEKLLDVGCGSGAFTIGAALRGYDALGLSWNREQLEKAEGRAAACGVPEKARFAVSDVRELDQQVELVGQYDVVICCEAIEHIIDDLRFMKALYGCLKPGGRLLLTTPNYEYRAVTPEDDGPFCKTETGWHVRRGYSPAMLTELCEQTGFIPDGVSFCSGFFSQKVTWLWRTVAKLDHRLGWATVLPFRALPLLLDRPIGCLGWWPALSICLVAYRPRFSP